jgi:hypothetical protein
MWKSNEKPKEEQNEELLQTNSRTDNEEKTNLVKGDRRFRGAYSHNRQGDE